MDILQNTIVGLFKEEHQAWANCIKDSLEKGTPIDTNLGEGFADRLTKMLAAFREYETRHKKKGGLFR
jgi:hypothetical protein